MLRDSRGFSIEAHVFSHGEIDQLAADLAGVARRRAGARHLMAHPAVAAAAHSARLIDIASQWLGAAAVPFKATLFDKSPEANWLVAWHQDTAVPLRGQCEVAGWGPWSVKAGVLYAQAPARALEGIVALRLHLDESASYNGPLRVLPGTHGRGVMTHEEIQECARLVQPEECLVSRGGIIAMRPLLVHASTKSTSDAPRRVLHIEYTGSLRQEAGLVLHVA